MQDRTMVGLGGASALLMAAMQLAGNGLHGVVPETAAEGLTKIAQHGTWGAAHWILTLSYIVIVPFAIGAAASFTRERAALKLAVPLLYLGAAIGIVHITSHLTTFRWIAEQFVAAPDDAARSPYLRLFDALWPWSGVLDVLSLLLVFGGAMLFSVAMLGEATHPRWLGWLGIVGGASPSIGIILDEFFITTTFGDLLFGFSMIPLVIWIVAFGIVLLKRRVPTAHPA